MRASRYIIAIAIAVLILAAMVAAVIAATDEEDKLVGTEAKDFTLPLLLEDKDVTLSSFEGKKAVVIDFFETWCEPCRKNLPLLEEFYNKHKKDVEVLSISTALDVDALKEFFEDEDNAVSFGVLVDTAAKTKDDYPHQFIPYMVVIDKDGKITHTHTGYDPELIAYLEEALGLE